MPEMSQADFVLLARYQALGTPDEIAKKRGDLERDNSTQRDEIRDLKVKVPADGHVVIPKADAELLPKYKELGKVDDIKAKIANGELSTTKLADVERRTSAAKFAKVAGIADEAVGTLVAIPALNGAVFEVRKGKVKDSAGKDVEQDIAYIKLPGENQQAMTYLDALEKVPELKGLRPAAPIKPDGRVTFVQQGATQGGEGQTIFDKIRAERKPAEGAQQPAAKSLEERLGMTRV